MRFFSYDFPVKQFTLYPIGDWHYGSRQCDLKFIERVVREIKGNPEAKWVGMGDLIENAIVGSKSDVYLQTIPPKEQVDEVIKLLEPIKEKGLFLVYGNHESRTMRVVGQQPEEIISYALRIPVAGYSACAVFDLTKAHTPRSFSCYFHHGDGGGYTPGGKVNAAGKLRFIVPTADATFSGHSHMTSRGSVTWFEPGRNGVLKKTGYDYITGSTLTWDESYAEEKAKRASTVEHIKVTFIGSTGGHGDNRRQVYEVITQDCSPPCEGCNEATFIPDYEAAIRVLETAGKVDGPRLTRHWDGMFKDGLGKCKKCDQIHDILAALPGD